MATQASREKQIDVMQSHWAPATRIIVSTIGIAAAGIRAGIDRGAVPGIAGLALVVRATTNIEFKRLAGLGTGKRPDDTVRKTA